MEKLIKLCIVLLFIPTWINAQGSWSPVANYPGIPVNDAVSFTIGNYGYVGTGDAGGSGQTEFWRFDPGTNSWAQMSAFPSLGRWEATGFAIGDKGYILGGYQTPDTCMNDFWEYSPLTNSWLQKPNYPGLNLMDANSFVLGSKAYVIAGRKCATTALTNHVWEYDQITDAWTQRLNVPTAARVGGIGFSIDSIGYYGMGMSSTGGLFKDLWKYDPNLNTWTQMANYPTAFGWLDAVGFSICQFGYAGTGTDPNGNCSSTFYRYDPIANSWTIIPAFYPRYSAMAFVVNNKAYVGGGSNQLFFDDYYEYDPQIICNPNIFAIQESSNVNHIVIGPNPTTGYICISSTEIMERCEIYVYSSAGELIFNGINLGMLHSYKIDLSGWPQGIYFIQIRELSRKSTTAKFVLEAN